MLSKEDKRRITEVVLALGEGSDTLLGWLCSVWERENNELN